MNADKTGPKPATNVFGFIDEVGLLHSPKEERIFAIGIVKANSATVLHKKIKHLRDTQNFYSEFKFSDVTLANLNLYKQLVDIFFSIPHTHFNCVIFDKNELDIKSFFKNDYYKAYNAYVAKLIINVLDVSENIVVVADDISTPRADNYEKEIKEKVKSRMRRNALFGIFRTNSHCIDEIQMVDVLLGVVAYSYKLKYGVVTPSDNARFRLLKYVQKQLNTAFLANTKKYELPYGRSFTIKKFRGLTIQKKAGSAVGTIANEGDPTPSAHHV